MILCLVFLAGIPARVYSGGFPGLKLGGGGRAAAMGLAYTALANDGSGGFWNPAGLPSLNRKDVMLTGHRWMEDVQSVFLGLGIGNSKTGYGFHMLYTEIAGLEHRIEPSPTPLAEFSTHEWVGGVSFARAISPALSVGFTLKLYYTKIFTEEAWGFGGDLGFLWRFQEVGLQLGGVIQNLGKTTDLRNEPVQLPLTARVGISYPVTGLGGEWVFALDGVKERDFPFHMHAGMEYAWQDGIFLRLGYQTGYHTRDVTGGVGFAWSGYRLDYTYIPLEGGLGDSHRVSLGISW